MLYPIVIHKDPKSNYGVTVPDLPGCFSSSDTIDNALVEATEAIECHLEGMLMDGEQIPSLQPIEQHQNNPDFAGGTWAVVPIDLSKLDSTTKRVNITIPERVLALIDNYASRTGETRSGLITHATLEYISTNDCCGR